MNNFGKLKDKILKKITESYSIGNKKEVQKILKLMKNDKEFKEMYFFYEGLENLELSYSGSAELYLESIEKILPEKMELIQETCKKIEQYVSDVKIDHNQLYDSIDVLSENTKLTNLDKKVFAKKNLIEHLSKKKNKPLNESNIYSENENLLMAVLTNNFNIIYDNTLNESEKEELKNILSMNNSELTQKTNELKESIFSDVEQILSESTDKEFRDKLISVKEQVSSMETNKYNYYRMTQLKDGLI
jgi:ferredoxin-fold anticodon binding domain-containing protein